MDAITVGVKLLGLREFIGDAAAAEGALTRLGRSAEKTATQANAAGAGMTSLGTRVAASVAALGIAAAATAVAASKMAAPFEASMEQIHTQAGVAQAEIAGLSDGVLKLAGTVATDPLSLSKALYHVESSFASTGITGERALKLLETSAKGAKIGKADLVDVTNALDASVVAAIPGVENFDRAMGSLNATVGSGDMSMGDLSKAFGTGVLARAKVFGLTIDDVGAALATFGDNNIRGALAGNQLAQVIMSLAQPSVGPAARAEMKKLGLTSDTLAKDMQTGGLNKAVTDLHDRLLKAGVTGTEVGKVIVNLFTKKAGAGIAILLDQFDRLQSKYEEIDKGANHFAEAWERTQDTVSVKWDKFTSTLQANMIRIGIALAPAAGKILDGLTVAAEAAGKMGPPIMSAARAVGSLVAALAPAVGFLYQHRDVIIAVSLAYSVRFIPSLAGLQAIWGRVVAAIVTSNALNVLLTGASGAAAAVKGLTAALFSMETVATAGLAAVALGVWNLWQAIDGGGQGGKDAADKLLAGFDANKMEDAAQQYNALAESVKAAQDAMYERSDDVLSSPKAFGKDLWNLLSGSKDNIKSVTSDVDAMNKQLDVARVRIDSVHENLVMMSMQTGMSTDELGSLASKLGVDLSAGVKASEPQRKKMTDYLAELSRATKMSAEALADAAGSGTEDWQKLADAIGKAQSAASNAFYKDVDVIGSYDPSKASKGVQAATDAVAKAQERLSDAQERASATRKTTVSEMQSVRHASDNLAAAQSRLATAQGGEVASSLREKYRTALALGKQFTKDLDEAMRRGLDPAIVSRLLQAGPTQAGPYLKAVLAGHSGTMIKMANDAETQLSKINAAVIEQARLTQIAVSSQNAQTSLDFQNAARISAEFMRRDGRATVEEISRSLHMSATDVTRIGKEFGINFATGVQSGLSSKPLDVTVTADYAPNRPGGSTYNQQVPEAARHALGGYVSGPGTGTSDSIPAWLSNGEYVMPAHRVAELGTDYLDALRAGYANGGLVWPTSVSTTAHASAATVGSVAEGARKLAAAQQVAAASAGGSAATGDGGSGVQRWTSVITSVLGALGESSSLVPAVKRRMDRESGGNPTIVNRWDSNWKKGTPSVGLMQVIGPTFRAYAGPHRGTGPFSYGVSTNPTANVYAGLNYAKHRYPSIAYAMDKSGGYRDGGLVRGPVRSAATTRSERPVRPVSSRVPPAPVGGGAGVLAVELHSHVHLDGREIQHSVQTHRDAKVARL